MKFSIYLNRCVFVMLFYYLLIWLNIAGCVAKSIDFDQMPRSAVSGLGLHCLLRPVCPNTLIGLLGYVIVVITVFPLF